MLRFWQRMRVGLLLIVFIGLGAYLFATTPWRKLLGIHGNYAAELAEGQPIVEGIYRYRAENGVWPEYVEDVVPRYLPALPRPTAGGAWFYAVDEHGPSLAKPTEQSHTYVGFDFDATTPAWKVFGAEDNRTLQFLTGSAATRPAQSGHEELIANELAVLEMRIGREKRNVDHLRDKASLLKSLGRTGEAEAVFEKAATDFPDAFWPRLAKAAADPAEIKSYAEWTAAHPSMTHYYYLSLVYRDQKNDDKTTQAIEAALEQPPEVAADDPLILPAYFFDMARWCLSKNNDALVLKITGAWERAQKNAHRPENSFLALRAGANLHAGNFDAARRDVETLLAQKERAWAENLEPLRQAIEQRNRTFVYDPGPNPASYQIFALPQ